MAAVLVPMLIVPLAAVLSLRVFWPAPTRVAAPALPPVTALAAAEDRTPEVRGRILDADGNPVQGANVRLLSPARPYTVFRDAVSERGGLFSFARVSPGRVRVAADHGADGFASSAELEAA